MLSDNTCFDVIIKLQFGVKRMSQNLHFQIQRKLWLDATGRPTDSRFHDVGTNPESMLWKWFHVNAQLGVQLSGAGVGSQMLYALAYANAPILKNITALTDLNK